MRTLILLLCFVVSCWQGDLCAQEKKNFEQFRKERQQRFKKFKDEKQRQFDEFRRKRNEEFAKYLRKPWSDVDTEPVIPQPKDDTVPPVVTPEEDTKPIEDNPVPYDEVIPAPKPTPQPAPVEPIEEIPEPKPQPIEEEPVVLPDNTQSFAFFGTPAKVRFDKQYLVKIGTLNENSIANVWLKFSEDAYTNLVYDCLKIREERKLCDWAYLVMLKEMADAIYGKNTNESTLLTAYVYCQSGYKMRLAMDGNKLVMLFASEHTIFNSYYCVLNGEKYYPFNISGNFNVRICAQEYPQERSLSLLVSNEPLLSMDESSVSSHQSTRNEDMHVHLTVNKNLLDFYTSYPTSMYGSNMVSRWAMYANMPMSEHVKKQIYPGLRASLSGRDQLTAVNKLLNFVQTGFVYEYDDKVWGDDRAFFSEESLFYPYCDCEDRSIMFTRLVRDLLGLNCILIFYPGHLAAAVEFTDASPTGDYILCDGHRYFITDPTIMGYGAPVGVTMSGMDNSKAKIILLK